MLLTRLLILCIFYSTKMIDSMLLSQNSMSDYPSDNECKPDLSLVAPGYTKAIPNRLDISIFDHNTAWSR